ncbi:cytochrome b/b6 domain-containing protein [Microbacterium rhizomatis]|uniref:cytochrome b/b6 domain-containing protein n=1 Tax=Microbacterium rhizomatis TaxID=1631477 RepID=UPI0031B5C7AB
MAPEPAQAPVAAPVMRSVRRGLPRVPGGEPWPPASVAPAVAARGPAAAASEAEFRREVAPEAPTPALAPPAPPVPATAPAASAAGAGSGRALRRGLPRVEGGEPWPPAGFAPVAAPIAESAPAEEPETTAVETPVATTAVETPVATTAVQLSRTAEPPVPPGISTGSVVATTGPRPPLPFTLTVWPGKAAASKPAALAEPKDDSIRSLAKRPPWPIAIAGVFGVLALLILAASAVLFVRWFLSLTFMQDFLVTYPGESHLPEGAPVGIPGWLAWQHFFNTFFMVLIIRTGLQVRNDKRPSAFWTPKWSKNGRGKISLSLWFHQSLDVLWLTNGVIFVVLLFATGQWMRVVPTSWDVIPNAISAALQYVSLDWPTENGWVNYNSLQVLAYFVTIFIAAPLAAITGVRMSGLWPKNAEKLNKAYPIEWARAVHFPVMLYFVAFIIVHVALVFATGALRNLNHMYGGQDAINWTGFWIFVGSLVLIVAAWIAARPLVLAPIARLSGKVSQR